MIGLFIRPGRRHDLAQCAVVFPLFVALSILVTLAIYNAWAAWLPSSAPSFWLWAGWVVTQWLTLVRLVCAEPRRSKPVQVFYRVQAVGLVLFAVDILAKSGRFDERFAGTWAICVEVALVAFFLNYFLLAVWTWTRISRHALANFAVTVSVLIVEILFARPSWS